MPGERQVGRAPSFGGCAELKLPLQSFNGYDFGRFGAEVWPHVSFPGEGFKMLNRLLASIIGLALLASSAFAATPTVTGGDSITAVLGGAITSSQPTYSIDSTDQNSGAKSTAVGSLNSTSAVTLLTGNTPQAVSSITIANIDTVAATVTIKKVASGTGYTLAAITLQSGDTLTMNDKGLQVVDSSGQLKNGGGTAVTAHSIPVHEWRKTDGVTINPVTAATTNFGVVYGTDGTDFPHLETIDGKNATTAVVSRLVFRLPQNYVAGSAVTLRAKAGMKTTVASNTGATTLGFNVYSNLGTANTGSADLNTTAAQSINSLTLADKDYTITPTNLVAGQDLHIKVTLTVTDVATGTAVIGTINHVELRTTTYR